MAGRVGLDKATVMQAATKIADEHGLAHLTIAAVAAKLGIRRQSVYAHVGSHQALMRALQLHHLRALGERLDRASCHARRHDTFAAVVREYVQYDLEHAGSLAVTQRRPEPGDPELWDAIAGVMGPVRAVLARYGIVDDEEALVWFRALWSSVIGYVTLSEAPPWYEEVDPHRTLDVLISSFAAALQRAARTTHGHAAGDRARASAPHPAPDDPTGP